MQSHRLESDATAASEGNSSESGVPAGPKRGSSDTRRGRWALGGSIATALLASACCLGPLLFALLGLGGAGVLVKFTPLRPYFATFTVALLAAGFYFTYRKPRAMPANTVGADGAVCACEMPRANKAGRVALWVVAVAVTGLLVSPYVIPLLLG